MKTNPLLAVLRGLTPDERKVFADLAGTSVNYLYQLAGCKRQPRRKTAQSVSAASKVIAERYGTTPLEVTDVMLAPEGGQDEPDSNADGRPPL